MVSKAKIYVSLIFLLMLLLVGIWFNQKKSEEFFISGGCDQSKSTSLKKEQDLLLQRITYCEGEDKWTGDIVITTRSHNITIFTSGYIDGQKISLRLENDGGDSLNITPPVSGERWVVTPITIPPSWKLDQKIKLVLSDNSDAYTGWGGVAVYDSTLEGTKLIIFTLFHALLITIPIALFILISMERGITNRVVLLSIGAGASGIFVFIDFWIWMLAHKAGIYFSIAVLGAMLYMCVERIRRCYRIDELREWGWIVTMWFCYSLFILSAGLAPWGIVDALTNVAHRFSPELPIDNQLPFIFAQQIASGKVAIPMIGDWLSSDRPPLQTAYFLASGAVKLMHSDFHYQVVATLLQCLWVIALWALLKSKNISRFAMLLTLGVPMFSGFAIVHGLFTWPKLLPVFFILLIIGILFDNDQKWLERWQTGVVVGVLAALAMLCHGGSIFALLGVGLGLFLFMRIPKPAFIVATIAAGMILMLVWSYYQNNIDPPGNRLTKWHLAGVIPIDDRSFRQTLIDSYRAISFASIWHNKWLNVLAMFGDPKEWFLGMVSSALGFSDITERISLRNTQFFTLLAAWGVFLLAPIALFTPKSIRTSSEYILGRHLLVIAASIIIFWVLLLFGPGYTLIHQGSLALPLLLFSGSVLVASAWSKIFAATLAVIHFLVTFSLYFSFGWRIEGVAHNFSLYIVTGTSLCLVLTALMACSMRITTSSKEIN